VRLDVSHSTIDACSSIYWTLADVLGADKTAAISLSQSNELGDGKPVGSPAYQRGWHR
jgi:hypothetical protein